MVLLADDTFKGGGVACKAFVQTHIMHQRVVILLYFSLQALDFGLQARTPLVGVLVKEQHEKNVAHGHNQRECYVTPAPTQRSGNRFIHDNPGKAVKK